MLEVLQLSLGVGHVVDEGIQGGLDAADPLPEGPEPLVNAPHKETKTLPGHAMPDERGV